MPQPRTSPPYSTLRNSLVRAALGYVLLALWPWHAGAQEVSESRVAMAYAPAVALELAYPCHRASTGPQAETTIGTRGGRAGLRNYVAAGAYIGMLLGLGYGIVEAVTCDECVPGTQVGFVIIDPLIGAAAGGAAGAAAYVVTLPFRRLLE